jgi:hypothetical protein
MNSTPQPPAAAGEHFADAERSWPPCHSSSGAPTVTATSRSRSSMLSWRSPPASSMPGEGNTAA